MKNLFTRHALLISGAFLLMATALNADTLTLRDGRRIQGQLISFQNGVIEFQESGFGGRVGRISRDEVTNIEFGRVDNNRYDRNDQPQNAPGERPRGLREKQLMAPANVAWSDTGIDLQSGQTIYFEASGEIRWGPNRRATPGGEQNSPNNPARPMPNRPGAALIGRVGNDSKDYFFIGDDRGAIRMRSSGRLYLGINDDALQDNTGYYRVIVYY